MSFRNIKLDAIEKATAQLQPLANRSLRPGRGWLRAVREALGLSLEDVAKAAKMSRYSINDFERAEASEKITLASLHRVADAMDCDVVYAILPKSGTFTALAEKIEREKAAHTEKKVRDQAAKLVRDVDHTMALEGQSTGRTKQRLAEEIRRIMKRRKK